MPTIRQQKLAEWGLVVALILASCAAILLMLARVSMGQDESDAWVLHDNELHLARICKLEAEGSLSDCTALYHIGRKRFGADWLAGLLRYSKLYERTTPRAKRIAAAPDGDIPGASRAENRRWRALRLHAVELVAGKHPDPCPRAIHWGGVMDIPKRGQVKAECAAQAYTANTLYRLEGK